MANFTPIATGAAANASVVNAPLYELDNAIITLQSSSAIVATRPFGVIGGLAQPTSSDNVPVTADITHTGKLVRGALTITSSGADMETRGNLAVGNGNHTMAGVGSIACGENNIVSSYSIISGTNNSIIGGNSCAFGLGNQSSSGATFLSGSANLIQGVSSNSTISGGQSNLITGSISSGIAAGSGNIINSAAYSFIGTGSANQISLSATFCGIGAGRYNWVYNSALGSFVAGGEQNIITNSRGFVGGGRLNNVISSNSLIGAGTSNAINGTDSGIVAGNLNVISNTISDPFSSMIGAGASNAIYSSAKTFIGGGESNTITTANFSAIVGGFTNSIGPATYAFIGAGNNNSISGSSNGFIGGGSSNTISSSGSGNSAIVGGSDNTITHAGSTVLGGDHNIVNGYSSVCGGTYGHITHDFTFLWNSWYGLNFASAATGEFAVTALGGFRLFSSYTRTTGMTMALGASSWTAISARALKGEFKDIEQQSILDRLLTVPIQSYRFKKQRQDETTKQMIDDGYHKHLNFGPVAEDWNSAFGDVLGEKTVLTVVDGKEIHTPAINEGDKLGVALAAIQGLAGMFGELKEEVNLLKQRLPTKAKPARGEV